MKNLFVLIALLTGTIAFADTVYVDGIEKRCGWVDNPTPANFWLTDAHAEWEVQTMGGHTATGFDGFEPLEGEQIKTNGNYGYTCGCINGTFDWRKAQVISVVAIEAKPILDCFDDKKLSQSYRPRTLIHSSGKAYTECFDQLNEREQAWGERKFCVNKAGEYYYLASE